MAIVTVANFEFYEPLQATVYHVHEHFPYAKLIIYDLGMDIYMRNQVIY